MDTRYAARVFAVAGIFNVVVGLSGLLVPDLVLPVIAVARPENPLFMQLAFGLILLLGIGYWLIAWHPERNHDLMLLGALGKLFVFPFMLWAWSRGNAGLHAVGAGFGDLVFALLFFDVLRRMRATPGRQA